MANYLYSQSMEVVKREQTAEEQRPILVEFKNGNMTSSGKKKLNFMCYQNCEKNATSIPKRILVAKSKRMYYAGSNFETEMSKITSSVLKVSVVNRKNSTVKMYDVDFFPLKPQLKSPEITQVKVDNKSYVERSSDLTVAFGSKTQQKTLSSRRKYGSTAATADSDGILTTISETTLAQNDMDVPTENSTSPTIPPQNKLATNVDEVYNLYDIISKEELDALSSDAAVFLNVKHTTIQLWKDQNKYSPFVIQFIENNVVSMNPDKAKLLCYLHYMFCFLRTVYADWKKKDPVAEVPEPFKQKLMDSFTVKKSMPMRLKDKLLAYAMVLGLNLNNFVLNCNLFASSTKIPMTRITSVAYALGCHVSGNKNNAMKTIELKLPLYKFQEISRKRKKN